MIRENRTLVSLNISWNKIICDSDPQNPENMIDVPQSEGELSEKNYDILFCLAQFIKYNKYLIHLDLSTCGLTETAVKYLCSFLTKAQALQCLHLDSN